MNLQEIFHDDIQYEKIISGNLKSCKEVKQKMGTLRDEALAYEPKQTLNIADIPEVPVELKLMEGEGTDEKGKSFTYKYAEFNGKEYRVPGVVLGEIKKILKLKPSVTKVKVKRSGTGLSTRYEVEALD